MRGFPNARTAPWRAGALLACAWIASASTAGLSGDPGEARVPPAGRIAEAAEEPDGTAAARRDFLRARELERAGRDSAALVWYGRAFARDAGSRDLCFLYLERLRDAGAVDSAVALGGRCAALSPAGGLSFAEHKLLGEIALRADDAPGALLHYRAADSLRGDDGDVLYMLAGLCEDAGNWDCHAGALERLLPRLDYPPRLMEGLALAYARLGRPESVMPRLREAWERTGRHEYGRALAAAYEARELPLSLLAVARSLWAEDPGPLHAWMLARAYAGANRPDSALVLCERLLDAEPENFAVRSLQASLLFEAGRYKEAARVAEELARENPAAPAYAFLAGSAALETRARSARERLAQALAAAPYTPEYRARLAYADYVFGAPGDADARLAYAPSENLEVEQALLLEGLAHGRLARDLEPRGAWERPAVFSDSAAAHRHRRAAVARFEAILARNSGHRAALFEAGAHLERLGELGRAKELLRRLVARDTTHALAMNYLAYTLVEQDSVSPDEMREAGRLLDRALAREPENGAYRDSKGWWHYKAGEPDSAEAWLRGAVAAMPGDPAVLEHLALVLHSLGKRGEACGVVARLRILDPGHRLFLHCPVPGRKGE